MIIEHYYRIEKPSIDLLKAMLSNAQYIETFKAFAESAIQQYRPQVQQLSDPSTNRTIKSYVVAFSENQNKLNVVLSNKVVVLLRQAIADPFVKDILSLKIELYGLLNQALEEFVTKYKVSNSADDDSESKPLGE